MQQDLLNQHRICHHVLLRPALCGPAHRCFLRYCAITSANSCSISVYRPFTGIQANLRSLYSLDLGVSLTIPQSAAFRSVLSTYSASFKGSQQYRNLVVNLGLNLPQSVIPQVTQDEATLLPVPTGSDFNLYSFATEPPTTFPQLAWESYLTGAATDLSSSIDGLRTSAVLALATSAQSVLGTSANIPTPSAVTASSSGAAAPAMAAPTLPAFAGGTMGIAAGVIGAAALLL